MGEVRSYPDLYPERINSLEAWAKGHRVDLPDEAGPTVVALIAEWRRLAADQYFDDTAAVVVTPAAAAGNWSSSRRSACWRFGSFAACD